MPTIDELLADVVAEGDAVAALVEGLDERGWRTPTPSPGWLVRDQVTHLAHVDELATLAIRDREAFVAQVQLDRRDPRFLDTFVEAQRDRPGDDVLAWFRAARAGLVEVAGAADPTARVPWYGPDMSLAAALTARIMETWAHGQDVADALGVERRPTARLRHVAFIGARALPNSFRANRLDVPDDPVRVELRAPDGSTWSFGPDDARDRVTGEAVDFCLVVTRRRHPSATTLVAEGAVARAWLPIAQAYAGPPGAGRAATAT